MRVVLDTNVLVRALLVEPSPPGQLIRLDQPVGAESQAVPNTKHTSRESQHHANTVLLQYEDLLRPRTIRGLYQGARTIVQLPPIGEKPIIVDGTEAPACKFWQSVISRLPISEDCLATEAHHALITRVICSRVIRITLSPEPGDDILDQRHRDLQGRIVHVVLRQNEEPFRPLLYPHGGIIARLDQDVKVNRQTLREIIELIIQWGEGNHLYPLGGADRILYFLPREYIAELFKTIALDGRQATLPEIQGRLGALLKRPGGRTDFLNFSRLESFSQQENDGTVAITRQVTELYQGTLVSSNGCITKGIIRPPLVIKKSGQRTSEPDAFCSDAQFGREYDGREACFHIFRRFSRERAALCYQAVLFGLSSPERFIEDENRKLEAEDGFFKQLGLGKDARRKVGLGIPVSLLIPTEAAWQCLTHFDVHASRGVAIGSDLVKPGELRLLRETREEFARKYRDATSNPLRHGAKLIVHRDPALPDSTSMHLYKYAGPIDWLAGNPSGIGVVFNPKDPNWQKAGGDFDGDVAVVFPRLDAHPLRPVVTQTRNFRDESPYQSEALHPTMRDAVLDLADVPVGMRGDATLICTKLAERGLLDPETAALGSAVIQGAFDVRKHAVRLGELYDAYRSLQSTYSRHSPIAPLTERLRPFMNAKGHREQKQEWKTLAEWAASGGSDRSAIENAMIRRINLLNNLFDKSSILLDNPELPALLVHAARAELAKHPDGESQRRQIIALKEEYLARTRKPVNQVADDSDMRTSDERKCSIRVAIRAHYQAGKFSAAALLGYCVKWLAAEIVSADEIERIAATIPSAGVTYLAGHGWRSGVYTVKDMQPARSTQGDFRLLVKSHERARVRIISDAPKSTKVWLEAF